MTDLKNIEKIVKFCRKHGILSLKTPEIDISLSMSHSGDSIYKRKKNNSTENSSLIEVETDEYTEEQILNWSVQEGMNG